MKEFDLITFDSYGTLIDWEDGIYQVFRGEAAKDGHQSERGKVIDVYGTAEAEMEGGLKPGNPFQPDVFPPYLVQDVTTHSQVLVSYSVRLE